MKILIDLLYVLSGIVLFAGVITAACACLAGMVDRNISEFRVQGSEFRPLARFRNPQSRVSQNLLTSSPAVHFIHRHDSFKPTPGNLLLLGFTAGAAVVAIVIFICNAITP